MESLQHAISVIIHSGLFSEKIPINFKSGVPSIFDFTTGQNFLFIIIFERDSTISSISIQVFHIYGPYSTTYDIFY